MDDFEVQHCFLCPISFEIGEVVHLEVDKDARKLHMRMHTTGHLIADLIDNHFKSLKAISGNHFPGDGYMKFNSQTADFPEEKEMLNFLNKAIIESKNRNTFSQIVIENGIRKLKIGNSEGVPCGGTHLNDLAEIGDFDLGPIKINRKESTITIKYEVRNSN